MPPTTSTAASTAPGPRRADRARAAAGRARGARRAADRPLPARAAAESRWPTSCATKGYGATTIADICEPAGVSRATFYELFKDKEDCFHAAMELSLADAMGRIVAVYSPDKPWATMVRDAAAAFLDLLASRPAFARMALVEAPSSGERAFELYASGKRVLQSLLDRGRDDPVEEEAIPSSAGRAALAAAESLIVGQILAGNTARLPRAAPRRRLHHHGALPRPGGGAAPVARGGEARSFPRTAERGAAGRGAETRALAAAARPPPAAARGDRPLPARAPARGRGRVVAEKGYARDHGRRPDPRGGHLPHHLLRDVRGQGSLLPGRLRQRGRRAGAAGQRRLRGRGGLAASGRGPGWRRCSRRLPRSRRWPASPWSTSAPPGRRRSAATGPRCSG